MTFYEDLVRSGQDDTRRFVKVERAADPGFSAGGDLRMMDSAPAALASPEGSTDIWRWIRNEFGGIARLIARSDTAFLAPEVGTSWALTRRLGYQGAFAFYAGGEQLDAERARELGLVHEVVPHGELLAAAERWCAQIAALPAHAIAMTKPLLRAAAEVSWDQALAMEEFAEPQCFTTQAFQETVAQLLAAR
jgi:2-(1,2-epoxy-1,2-dihydrophenyl)acetyl-CoA isomerase